MDKKDSNSNIVPSYKKSLAVRPSFLIKRGLKLAGEIKDIIEKPQQEFIYKRGPYNMVFHEDLIFLDLKSREERESLNEITELFINAGIGMRRAIYMPMQHNGISILNYECPLIEKDTFDIALVISKDGVYLGSLVGDEKISNLIFCVRRSDSSEGRPRISPEFCLYYCAENINELVREKLINAESKEEAFHFLKSLFKTESSPLSIFTKDLGEDSQRKLIYKLTVDLIFSLDLITMDLKSRKKSKILNEMNELVGSAPNYRFCYDEKSWMRVWPRKILLDSGIPKGVGLVTRFGTGLSKNTALIALAISKDGVIFPSADGKPVNLIFDISCNDDLNAEFLGTRLIEDMIEEIVKDSLVRETLINAESKEEAFYFLKSYLGREPSHEPQRKFIYKLKFLNLIFSLDLITLDLKSKKKDEAIKEITELFVNAGIVKDGKAFYESIREREREMSTGLFEGLAIPYAKVDEIEEGAIFIALAISKDGVDFDSLDGEPAHLIFLSAQKAASGYNRRDPNFLDWINTTIVEDESIRKTLINAESKEFAFYFLKGYLKTIQKLRK